MIQPVITSPPLTTPELEDRLPESGMNVSAGSRGEFLQDRLQRIQPPFQVESGKCLCAVCERPPILGRPFECNRRDSAFCDATSSQNNFVLRRATQFPQRYVRFDLWLRNAGRTSHASSQSALGPGQKTHQPLRPTGSRVPLSRSRLAARGSLPSLDERQIEAAVARHARSRGWRLLDR